MKRTKNLKNTKKQDEYVPTFLRDRPESGYYEGWSIGSIGAGGTVFWHKGPFNTELAALEMPGQKGWRIIHRHTNGTDSVDWVWNKDRWIKLKGNKIKITHNVF